MKKLALITLLIAMVAGIMAVEARTLIQPSKKNVTKTYKVSNFNELKVVSVYDVEYEQSTTNTWSLEITAPDNILPYVEVRRSGSSLILALKKDLSTRGDYKLKAKIKAPALEDVTLGGASSFKAGKINLAGREFEVGATGASEIDIKTIVASKIDVDLTGASKLKVGSVSANEIEADVTGASEIDMRGVSAGNVGLKASGASDIDLAGKAETLSIKASGASKVKTDGLRASSGRLEASGASDIKASVSNVLYQRASGASTIINKK
ncbi:MAG: DUF2807 domain-containing protein [Bacteroidales bacterium]|nr:DUF2807 domain-containing protein [Bacteroidales bacterium]